MTTQAKIGARTVFAVEDAAGSGVYVNIAEVTGITPPNEQSAEIDVTNMDSPPGYQEFVVGLTNPGDMSFAINHIQGSATDDFIAAWRASGETRACKYTFVSGKGLAFSAFVKGFAPDKIEPSNVTKSTVTLKVSGAPVRF